MSGTSAMPALDRARLAALAEELGDPGVVRAAAQTFLDELPERLSAVGAAVGSGDRTAARDAAHALASPAGMLGVVALAAAALAVQDAAPTAADLEPLVVVLGVTAQDAAAELRDFLTA